MAIAIETELMNRKIHNNVFCCDMIIQMLVDVIGYDSNDHLEERSIDNTSTVHSHSNISFENVRKKITPDFEKSVASEMMAS